jgi:glycosyltransferase involved in cell wall biosynthesis
MDERLQPLIERVNLGLITLWGKVHRRSLFHSTYFTSPPARLLPHVAMVHDLNHEIFARAYSDAWGQWLRARYPVYLRGATRIIAVSNTTKSHVVDIYGISPSLIDVVHHAVDRTVFFVDRREQSRAALSERLGIHSPYFLYVGLRSWQYKNFATLLHAFARLRYRRDLTLLVVGAPWNERERSEIQRLELNPFLRLIEHPDDETLRILYSSAAAFIYPSLNEGFGIPLLEGMACGTPVVAADTTVFREVAGDAALYFDPADPDALVQAMDASLGDATRRDYTARGFDRLRQYSWDESAAATYAAYERTLG